MARSRLRKTQPAVNVKLGVTQTALPMTVPELLVTIALPYVHVHTIRSTYQSDGAMYGARALRAWTGGATVEVVPTTTKCSDGRFVKTQRTTSLPQVLSKA